MKLPISLFAMSFALAGCDTVTGGTYFDEVFHPKGMCAKEVKLQNNSSRNITIVASLYDDRTAYCSDGQSSRDEKVVGPGEFGMARAELNCHRCYNLRETVTANGEDVSESKLVTCTDNGCLQN